MDAYAIERQAHFTPQNYDDLPPKTPLAKKTPPEILVRLRKTTPKSSETPTRTLEKFPYLRAHGGHQLA